MRCQAGSGDPSMPVHDHWEDHNLSGKECVHHQIFLHQLALILQKKLIDIITEMIMSRSICFSIQSGERMNKYWVKCGTQRMFDGLLVNDGCKGGGGWGDPCATDPLTQQTAPFTKCSQPAS